MGADRLVNGVAGFYKYGGPCVIVDLGTTINFDVISQRRRIPGRRHRRGHRHRHRSALHARPRACRWWISAPPKDVVGTNTVASMQSGLYFGAIGMIDGILERIIAKLGPDTKTVATGGQAHLIVSGSRYLEDRGRASHARRPANDLGAEPAVNRSRLRSAELLQLLHRNRGALPARPRHQLCFCCRRSIGRWWKAGRTPACRWKPCCAASTRLSKNGAAASVKTQMVNSLAFCAQAVLTEAQIMAGAAPARAPARRRRPSPPRNCARIWKRNAAALPRDYEEIAASLRKLAAEIEQHLDDLEALEQRLTVLEEKMIAAARTGQSEEALLASRRELDRQLRPYRGKMTAGQLAMLEKQYLERNLLEKAELPRLSLFYMR